MRSDKGNIHHQSSFLQRYFPQRDILIRNGEQVRYITLKTPVQVALCSLLMFAFLWGIFASVCFFKSSTLFYYKEKRYADVSDAYQNLMGEVKALNDQLAVVLNDLEDGRAELEQAQPAEPFVKKISEIDDDKSKETVSNSIVQKIQTAQSGVGLIHKRLMHMVETGRPERGPSSYYKATLQRDLAMAETITLQKKVREQEELISDMQDTQILVFRKMASIANDSIGLIEDDLSGIRQSLNKTGLGMASLLNRIRREKEVTGIGGPFIPVNAPRYRDKLNISLVSLNQRLDHWYDLTSLQNALPIGKPVDRIRVTSPFGAREDPFQGAPARHEAVDLGGMNGEPIYTTAPGKVVRAGRWGWYGNMVEIDHGLGFRTRYAHMDKVYVTKGDAVRAGDKIGTVGSTGRSTGAHLHYEIRVRGYAVDPMNFIKASRNVFKG